MEILLSPLCEGTGTARRQLSASRKKDITRNQTLPNLDFRLFHPPRL
jgi:hypothetical protein